jgi:[ribosomal protein S5]-alanine N-acetyltransferase
MSGNGQESSLPRFPEGYRLQSERLILRAVAETDAAGFWPMVSDPNLPAFLAWEAHRSIDETSGMLAGLIDAQKAGNGFHWAIVHEDRIVGLVSLIDVKRRHRSWTLNRAELAYWIGVPFQRQGFATDAAVAVIGFGFAALGLHKIRVYHAADNPASGRTIAKLGFRFVGEEREAFQKNGQWHHLRHYELLKSEFRDPIPYLLRTRE